MPDAARVRLRPMTQEEFATYSAGSVRAYALEMAASGQLDLEAAEKRSALEYAELLPDGLDSPRMHLWTAETGDPAEPAEPAEPVGLGWIELRERSAGVTAWVYDISVDAARRGQGLGRAVMEALHEAARDLGATSISLNVFGHNATAIHLYESLGYVVTAQQMKRDL